MSSFRTTRKVGRLGVVSLYDIKGVSLVVFEYSYERVVSEGGGSNGTLVGCICNQANEVIYVLIDLFGEEVGEWGMEGGIEFALFLMAPPSKELMRVGNLEGTLGTR